MTEQSSSTDADSESADARIDWPAPSAAAADDPAVAALLVRLNALPELPVADHGEVYAGLHDELAAALNEDVSGQRAEDSPR
ncbi:hypothetical protein [Arthrobacter sp. C9C5]|uniref:hypothetical protein n=1 Tax=Arthrobacter sp. C9C5 TaxID=2735267 RepID=UPI0015846064|nr:hypothetical protein [Arthrobacter sp. C9C5]NUU30749.1 hypothetical protein [Arthrobacter sp. C9C5]